MRSRIGFLAPVWWRATLEMRVDPDKLKQICSALNAQLTGPTNVAVGFGSELYAALVADGIISTGSFRNPAYPLGVGTEFLPFPAYGGAHPAIETSLLPPDGFLIGFEGQVVAQGQDPSASKQRGA